MVYFEPPGILSREGLRKMRERYPALTDAILDLDITKVDAGSENDLGHLLEVVIQQLRLKRQKRQGTRRGEWSMDRWESWLDHLYKLTHKEIGTEFVSEPYELFTRDIQHLARLADKGWEVFITARDATHYPGHTLQVAIQAVNGRRGAGRALSSDIKHTCEEYLKQPEIFCRD